MAVHWLDHTADDGFVVEAPMLAELFNESAQALLSMLVDDPDTVVAQSVRDMSLSRSDWTMLLFDWLSELLWLFNGERWLWRQIDLTIDESVCSLQARLRGEPFDPERHATGPEIKAITWHRFAVERSDGVWRATVIVDI